jgi:hypothetical protein
MDGTNCRSPMGCGMNREGAIEQSWQSNRAVRMENVGQTDVVDPWLSDGRNSFRSLKEIVASVVTPGMSDADKARALWYQQIQHRYHSSAGGEDLGDPVKVFNIYGLNPCGKDAMMMGGLWKQVGLKGAPVRLVGHAIAQVNYDGAWHVMDGDLDMIYLLRDNETLASDRQLARDHDLVKRTHTMGILVDDSRKTANFWDIEKPKFALEAGPAWLKIDPSTGVLSGTPEAAGKVDVAVTTTIDQAGRKLDDGRLGWGVEQVLSTSTERVGSATRRYSIEIVRHSPPHGTGRSARAR